jgi:hypothetical protein
MTETQYEFQLNPKIKEAARKVAPYAAVGLVCFVLGRHSVTIPVIPPPVIPVDLKHVGEGFFKVLMSDGAVWITKRAITV